LNQATRCSSARKEGLHRAIEQTLPAFEAAVGRQFVQDQAMAFDTLPTIMRAVLPGARLTAALALAGFLTLPATAQPATPSAKPPAKPRQTHAAPERYAPAPIICTKRGCAPLPRGCHAETEFTWDGDPTGYQFIVCP
jgi:hypothetical protein